MIKINLRTLNQSQFTGVQRYTSEIFTRLQRHLNPVMPRKPLFGIKGHIWEQFILPFSSNNGLLFSPANTGPAYYKNQIVTIHDMSVFDYPEYFDSKFGKWYRYLLPKLVNNCIGVITVSDFSKNRILNHIDTDPDKIIVVPNGINFENITKKDASFSIYQFTENLRFKRYVLCVGTIEPRKNISSLLQAWSKISNHISDDLCLIITGKKDSLIQFAKSNTDIVLPDNVFFSGFVTKELLYHLYANSELFVYPSLYEGFGLPPLEAMASGVPIISSNISSIPEVVGDAGLLIDPTFN